MSTPSNEVYKVTPQFKGRQARPVPQFKEKSDHAFFRCGRAGHLASKCKFKVLPLWEVRSSLGCVLWESKGHGQEARATQNFTTWVEAGED